MRFSATTLDVYARVLAGKKSEAELLAYIRRETPPTRAMLFGRAFGRILEDPDRYRVPGGYACDGFRVEAADVEPALATIDRTVDDLEVSWTKSYGAHTVSCRVDALRGRRVTEFKARIGGYDSSRYHGSYQWRFELDVFDALEVTYRVFRFSKRLRLRAIHELPLTRTRTLSEDCARLVALFAGYVQRQGLELHFTDRPQGELYIPRSRAEEDVPLFSDPTSLPPRAPIAALPDPTFTLRPYPRRPSATNRLFQ